MPFSEIPTSYSPHKTVAIIGGGYCGTLTAVHLMSQAKTPLHIVLINSGYPLTKGVAYSSYTNKHLLNVAAKNMSAFPDKPNHFIDWIQRHENYRALDRTSLPNMFLPRNIYGYYLKDIFDTAIRKKPDTVSINFIHDEAIDAEIKKGKAHIYFSVSPELKADKVVLAIGNHAPANPNFGNDSFYASRNYYSNPWVHEAVNYLDPQKEVLIIGNGLTMVDVVLGLKEKKHEGKIYSLSPNGFQVLPHRTFEPYKELMEELKPPYDLMKVVKLFRKHVKKLREQGVTAEAVVDSIRPLTQQIWKSLAVKEKKRFIYHIRHMWGVARHRLPMHIHEQMQQLILDDKLEIIAGRIVQVTENESGVHVSFRRRSDQETYKLNVGRVINCTGPLSDIHKMQRPLMQNLAARKLIHADEMRLGINAKADGTVLNEDKTDSDYFCTLGSAMRGILWESTAVPELRIQAKDLADKILKEVA